MTLEQFQQFDKTLIEKLGRQEVGWQWRKLSELDKIQTAHALVSDSAFYTDRIRDTNFDKFLAALRAAVGGSNTQVALIQKQIEVELRALSHGKDICKNIQGIYRKRLVLGEPTGDLPASYWCAYDGAEKVALASFTESPLNVESLASPFREISEYYRFACSVGWTLEADLAKARLLRLVRLQFGTIFERGCGATILTNGSPVAVKNGATEPLISWSELHSLDWVTICQSLLVLSCNLTFCVKLFHEKAAVEALLRKWAAAPMPQPNCGTCPRCGTALDLNQFCSGCKTFFAPTESCEILKRKADDDSSRLKYSLFHDTALSPLPFKCTKGCTLSSNGHCAPCDVFYTWKGDPRKSTCFECNGTILTPSGRCDYQYCRSTVRLKIEEHPLWDEVFGSRVYDASEGSFEPKHPGIKVRVPVPVTLSDPQHFGHLAWQYCQFMDALDE